MSPQRSISLIMVGLLAWGMFHALGAYRYNQSPWRALMVLACSLGFLGFWRMMLALRGARLERQASRLRDAHAIAPETSGGREAR